MVKCPPPSPPPSCGSSASVAAEKKEEIEEKEKKRKKEWGQILTDRRMEVKLGGTVFKNIPRNKHQNISSYLLTNIPQFVHKLGPKNEISTTRFSPICNQRLEGDTKKLHKGQEGLCWMEYTSP